mmetsp:Transcript_66930/g.172342  ORF Transcript_66930/g.172342 Transcript_66930/m.172342 type:complete len:366 (-) Transcript_66930:63-1160(-)
MLGPRATRAQRLAAYARLEGPLEDPHSAELGQGVVEHLERVVLDGHLALRVQDGLCQLHGIVDDGDLRLAVKLLLGRQLLAFLLHGLLRLHHDLLPALLHSPDALQDVFLRTVQAQDLLDAELVDEHLQRLVHVAVGEGSPRLRQLVPPLDDAVVLVRLVGEVVADVVYKLLDAALAGLGGVGVLRRQLVAQTQDVLRHAARNARVEGALLDVVVPRKEALPHHVHLVRPQGHELLLLLVARRLQLLLLLKGGVVVASFVGRDVRLHLRVVTCAMLRAGPEAARRRQRGGLPPRALAQELPQDLHKDLPEARRGQTPDLVDTHRQQQRLALHLRPGAGELEPHPAAHEDDLHRRGLVRHDIEVLM